MNISQARKIVKETRESGQDRRLPALAFKYTQFGESLTDDATIEPIVHPTLEAHLLILGATKSGRMSFRVGMGEDGTSNPVRFVLRNLAPGMLWAKSDTYTTKGPRDMGTGNVGYRARNLMNVLRGSEAAHLLRCNAYGYVEDEEQRMLLTGTWPEDGTRFGGVSLSQSNNTAHIRVFTHIPLRVLPDDVPKIQLNLNPAERAYTEPKRVVAAEAAELAAWLQEQGAVVLSEDNAFEKALEEMHRSVIAVPTPGKPAVATVTIGRSARMFMSRLVGDTDPASSGLTSVEVPSTNLSAALGATPFVSSHLHPGVADIVAMVESEPYEDEELWHYQKDAVGVHLSTNLGYLNCCSPGLGKTIQALVGMRERARNITGYRALIVVESNVRTQWAGEAQKWFADARVFTVKGAADAAKLDEVLAEAGDQPLLVLMSYAMLKQVYLWNELLLGADIVYDLDEDADDEALETTAVDTPEVEAPVVQAPRAVAPVTEADPEQFSLLDFNLEVAVSDVQDEPEEEAHLGRSLLGVQWNDLVADEAEVLRGTGKQASALWLLRHKADVALALTGTPINKGLDDLGRLLAWVRKDQRMFYGVKMSDTFNLETPEGLQEFSDAMGPVLFRRDTSEISDELPKVNQVEMMLSPSPAEIALADAATRELKRVFQELSAAIEHAELLDPENPAYAEARDALRQARGAWLGGTQLARMAASDPAALLGSQSAAAMLLAGQGLIEAATQVPGTKRTAVVIDVVERVARGEAVIVFTEFATVAEGLIADLDASGVRTGKIVGGNVNVRDRNVAAFQAGELDVLVATSSGERGLNLQRANTIVHYDLPWTPKGIIQRTGRARRLMSENDAITVVFPIMTGTIEERVAAKVVTRAVESMRALDTSRGVDASVTEMGLALGGLAQKMGATREGRRFGSELMEITAELVGDGVAA